LLTLRVPNEGEEASFKAQGYFCLRVGTLSIWCRTAASVPEIKITSQSNGNAAHPLVSWKDSGIDVLDRPYADHTCRFTAHRPSARRANLRRIRSVALLDLQSRLKAIVDASQRDGCQMAERSDYIPLLDGEEIRAIDYRNVMKSRRSTVASRRIDKQLRRLAGPDNVSRDHRHNRVRHPMVIVVVLNNDCRPPFRRRSRNPSEVDEYDVAPIHDSS
jgi:hypothetical protein